MDYVTEYKNKLRTPEEAVKIVKSGDWIDYTTNLAFPELLDAALAKPAEDLPLAPKLDGIPQGVTSGSCQQASLKTVAQLACVSLHVSSLPPWCSPI